MLGLSRIVDVAKAMQGLQQVSSITFARERCTRFRHCASTCSRCVDVCPSVAVSFSENYPALDIALCTECGACASVCPTEAIEAKSPTDKNLSEDIAESVSQKGSVTLACKQAGPMPPGSLSVACLARLDLSMFSLALAEGAVEVSLITGACGECESGAVLPYISNSVMAATALAEVLGASARFSIQTSTPTSGSKPNEAAAGFSRRSFLTKLGKGGAGCTAEAATMLITPTSKRTDDGAKHRDLVFYLPEKRRRFVEALRVLTERTTGTHSATILFSLPKVDAVQCIGCSMCADLCPTGALEAKEEAGMLRITCNATDCVACNLCVDACYKHAISLSPGDESIRSPHRVVVLEQQHKDDLLAPVEDKMSRLLGVGLYRT